MLLHVVPATPTGILQPNEGTHEWCTFSHEGCGYAPRWIRWITSAFWDTDQHKPHTGPLAAMNTKCVESTDCQQSGCLFLRRFGLTKTHLATETWKANPVTISCSSYHVLKHLVHQENRRLVKTWTANAYTQMLQNTQCVSDSARYECGEHWTLPRFPRLHLLEAVLPSPTHKMSLFSALAPLYPVNQRAPRSTVPRANDVFADGILWEPKTGFHVLGKCVDRSVERLTLTKFCPGIETLLNWIPRHSTKNKLIFK